MISKKTRSFRWFSSNSEVEATWASLIGWPHKTSTTYVHCKSNHLFSHPQEVSIFVFDKKSVDKLHKPKRKEAMTELLKNGLGHLQCYRHPKLLLGAFHSSLNANQQRKVAKYLFLLNYNWYFVTKIVLTHCEKSNVLVIEKNFWNSQPTASNLRIFWDH